MLSLEAVFRIAALMTLVGIAVVDIRRRVIPDQLVVVAACAAIASRLLADDSPIWLSLVAASVVFLVLGVMGHAGWLGGGDVKLIPAVTLLVAPSQVLSLLLAIAVAGGVLSVVYIAMALGRTASASFRSLRPLAQTAGAAIGRNRDRSDRNTLPYAVAILGGCAFQFVHEGMRCFYAISCSQ